MTLIDGDDAVWDTSFAVNLGGAYNLVRSAGPTSATATATSCSPRRWPPRSTCR